MLIGIGFVFFWTIWKEESEVVGTLIYVLAGSVAVGAATRIYARITYGNPGTAGTVPVVIESAIPILLVFLRYSVAKDANRAPK